MSLPVERLGVHWRTETTEDGSTSVVGGDEGQGGVRPRVGVKETTRVSVEPKAGTNTAARTGAGYPRRESQERRGRDTWTTLRPDTRWECEWRDPRRESVAERDLWVPTTYGTPSTLWSRGRGGAVK